MSDVVLGVGASHSTLMHGHRERPETQAAAYRYERGLRAARDAVRAAQPDVAVIIGSNHFRGLWLDLLPAFTIGVGQCTASGEAGTPRGPLAVDTVLARTILDATVADGFDLAFSLRLQVDHGISHAVQYVLDGLDVPIVPILVNVFAPPLPTLGRCDDLGRAIARAIAGDRSGKRVVVIGSGGLSHRLPYPKWDDPRTDGERFLVEAWLDGRGKWEEYDQKRRSLTLSTEPRINPEFDEQLLSWIEDGAMATLRDWSDEQVEEIAGNGGHEVRAWLMAAAATGHAPGRRLSYDPVEEWLTGMAVALMEPASDKVPSGTAGNKGVTL